MATFQGSFSSVFAPSLLSLLLLGCGGATPAPQDASQEPGAGDETVTSKSNSSPAPEAKPSTPGSIPAPSDVAAAPADSLCTESGLCMRTLAPPRPSGAKPKLDDQVDVHYTGWKKNGEMFDSSIPRGASITLPVGAVIPGWTEALQLMQEGGSYRIWIPAALAYGDNPEHPQAPGGPLTFDVELLQVFPAPTVPADVAAPPASATCTQSGLCYVLLKSGSTAGHRPGPEDQVVAHYTGWTQAGEQFDSSIPRGRPSKFQVNKVIPGWTEVLQLMDEGSKVRVWIPSALAYGDAPANDAPAGQLTFEIELLVFQPAAKP